VKPPVSFIKNVGYLLICIAFAYASIRLANIAIRAGFQTIYEEINKQFVRGAQHHANR
jgi:hypothetical protein